MASASSFHILMASGFSSASNNVRRGPSTSIAYYTTNIEDLGIRRSQSVMFMIKCESKEPPAEMGQTEKASKSLEIGSPIIVIEAPKMLKTAASVPCLRVNSGLVKPGDVGRIVSRKPKDVWAVRLAIGTYLIDAKYFKPLQLDEDD